MTTRTPAALRASLDARLQLLARERGQDVNRLRRHLTFQRMLRRLDETWVVKGGYLLEARLGARARATKDLDLALAEPAEDLAARLAEALDGDIDGDGFVFRVSGARSHLRDDDALGGPGAHVSVTALLAGRDFAHVRVDVVARPEEVDGGVERVILPPVVAEPGWPAVSVLAVDVSQHLAEKLHALSAIDAHPRPSTRVKDLVDVVLVADAGLVDVERLARRLRAVFRARDGALPPPHLPEPPAAWRADYADLVAPYSVSATDVTTAITLTRDLYARALGSATPTEEQQ